MVFVADGASGGKIFPFCFFAFIGVLEMARFEVGVTFHERAIFDYAAANTSRKGEIERASFGIARLGESGEVGIIFDVNWKLEFFFEELSDVEIVPRKVAEPDGAVMLDNAGHGNGDGFNFGEDKVDLYLLQKRFVEFGLVNVG